MKIIFFIFTLLSTGATTLADEIRHDMDLVNWAFSAPPLANEDWNTLFICHDTVGDADIYYFQESGQLYWDGRNGIVASFLKDNVTSGLTLNGLNPKALTGFHSKDPKVFKKLFVHTGIETVKNTMLLMGMGMAPGANPISQWNLVKEAIFPQLDSLPMTYDAIWDEMNNDFDNLKLIASVSLLNINVTSFNGKTLDLTLTSVSTKKAMGTAKYANCEKF